MIQRDLSQQEMEEILKRQCYGHLGFINEEGKVTVLPITYVYDDGIYFSFSTRGSKIEAMHKHPKVCIQVEELDPPYTWKSVVAWGTFSEVGSNDIGKFELLVEDFWKRTDTSKPIFSVFRDFLNNPSTPMTLYHVTVEKMVGKEGGHERGVML